MHFDLSTSGRLTVNGWVQIPCPLSTLARWPLWAVNRLCKLIASHSGLSKVSVIGRCLLRQVLLYMLFHSPQNDPRLSLKIDNTPIEHVDNFNFLELTINKHRKWNSHIDKNSFQNVTYDWNYK